MKTIIMQFGKNTIKNMIELGGRLLYGRQFKEDKGNYIRLNQRKNFEYLKKFEKPYYTDRYHVAGHLGAYFWQDLWAARHLFEDRRVYIMILGQELMDL